MMGEFQGDEREGCAAGEGEGGRGRMDFFYHLLSYFLFLRVGKFRLLRLFIWGHDRKTASENLPFFSCFFYAQLFFLRSVMCAQQKDISHFGFLVFAVRSAD